MRRLYALVIIGLISLLSTSALFAQSSGGQIWIRAFEDRNGNGTQDANEPLLTRGISVNLLNADGIIIGTALLDEAPTASQGSVGFTQLPAGQYTLTVTSADFTPTTLDSFTTSISDSGVAEAVRRFEFGAQRIDATVTTPENAATGDLDLGSPALRIAISAIGAAFVVFMMIAVGIILYLTIWRGRIAEAKQQDIQYTTGTMRPVRSTTGSYPKVE